MTRTTNQDSRAGGASRGSSTDSGAAADAEPAIAPAMPRVPGATRRAGVAIYWAAMPAADQARATQALAGVLGPLVLQRVMLPESRARVGLRLPRPLRQAQAELLLCAGDPRPVALAEAWLALLVDDLARHPEVGTVVLAGLPAPAQARLALVLRAARRRCVLLPQAAPGQGACAPRSAQPVSFCAEDVPPASSPVAPAPPRRRHPRRLAAAHG